MRVLNGFSQAPKIKDRKDFPENFIKWVEQPVKGGFNMNPYESEEGFSLKPQYSILFFATCPENSLWTEASPEAIRYKLIKVFYERANAGLEQLAMAAMRPWERVAGCSELTDEIFSKMEREIDSYTSDSIDHMNEMPFFERTLKWYANYN